VAGALPFEALTAFGLEKAEYWMRVLLARKVTPNALTNGVKSGLVG
jgi:hypothetical protein